MTSGNPVWRAWSVVGATLLASLVGCGDDDPENELETAPRVCEGGTPPQSPRNICDRNKGVDSWPESSTGPNSSGGSDDFRICNVHAHLPRAGANLELDDEEDFVQVEHDGITAGECATELALGEGTEIGSFIEVHWVRTNVPAREAIGGDGLDDCLPEVPNTTYRLKMEAKIYRLVPEDDPEAEAMIPEPSPSGEIIEYEGSTTGPHFTSALLSCQRVGWTVHTNCARLRQSAAIGALTRWGRAYGEADGVLHASRETVEASPLLSPLFNDVCQ